MNISYLERNPLVVQRITSLRIFKDKEESISDCMRRIYDAYLSAELNKAPIETLALLHLLILLPDDPLSEKIKTWLVEKMRLKPNIDNLDEVGIRPARVSSRSQRRSQPRIPPRRNSL